MKETKTVIDKGVHSKISETEKVVESRSSVSISIFMKTLSSIRVDDRHPVTVYKFFVIAIQLLPADCLHHCQSVSINPCNIMSG